MDVSIIGIPIGIFFIVVQKTAMDFSHLFLITFG
jgi:hypothetical protein